MSKRGAGDRDGYTSSQGNMRKARVEVRRVDAIQLLMAAARSRGNQPQQHLQQAGQLAAAVAALTAAGGPSGAQQQQPSAPTAPCTHCGMVLPVSAASCSLRQCCACLDVFCSLCSVLDYEEREDRVFCLSCLEEQAAASRANRGGRPGDGQIPGGSGARGTAAAAPNPSLMALGGSASRWGQLDQLGLGGPACSPFPCSRTPPPPPCSHTGSRTPGSAVYSHRSHRGFSALLAYGGAGS